MVSLGECALIRGLLLMPDSSKPDIDAKWQTQSVKVKPDWSRELLRSNAAVAYLIDF